VELFVEAAALGADFKLDNENFGAIVSICRRLDGIPLAIEFAAARTVMLRPPEIAAAGRPVQIPDHRPAHGAAAAPDAARDARLEL
jgi:hypothetical protein